MSQIIWNLHNYNGPGLRVKDEEGRLVSIIMDEDQERIHDRGYREYLIRMGKLIPSKKD